MTEPNQKDSLDLADLSDLDLTPDWARSEPGSVRVNKTDRHSGGRKERGGGRSGSGGRARTSRSSGGQGQRRDRDRKGGRDDRPVRTSKAVSSTPRPAPRSRPAPVKVSFLPERKGLGIVVRRIRNAKKAFALPDIAALFLSKPEYYLLKLEVEGGSQLRLFQCSLCGEIFRTVASAHEHVFEAHADNFFDIETVADDPPTGNFPCIAKCGISGELIGPPNHHTYREKLLALHAAHCPDMPLRDYESRIVTLADEELVEKWKESASLRTQYRPKDQNESDPIDSKSARTQILENHAPKLVKSGRRFVMPAPTAWNTGDDEIMVAFKLAWNREKKFPLTLIHALRPALRHMKLHVFKLGAKKTFVTAVEPTPIDPADSISPIKEGLQFIKENPGCKRDDLARAMAGGEHKSEEEIEKIIKSIHWLVDCGHLTEFADGSLLLPEHS